MTLTFLAGQLSELLFGVGRDGDRLAAWLGELMRDGGEGFSRRVHACPDELARACCTARQLRMELRDLSEFLFRLHGQTDKDESAKEEATVGVDDSRPF
jgi:hypothetical protein